MAGAEGNLFLSWKENIEGFPPLFQSVSLFGDRRESGKCSETKPSEMLWQASAVGSSVGGGVACFWQIDFASNNNNSEQQRNQQPEAIFKYYIHIDFKRNSKCKWQIYFSCSRLLLSIKLSKVLIDAQSLKRGALCSSGRELCIKNISNISDSYEFENSVPFERSQRAQWFELSSHCHGIDDNVRI